MWTAPEYEPYDAQVGALPASAKLGADGFDQPAYEAYEHGAPPPSDGGKWVFGVAPRIMFEVVQAHGPQGEYDRYAVVRRMTTKGHWLFFPRGGKLAAAFLRDNQPHR